MATLDDLYAQFLGAQPPAPMLGDPLGSPFGPTMPPFSGDPGGFAMPFGEMTAAPESEMVDPMLGVTPAFGATTTAGAQYGYSPQPRPALPAPIADEAAGLYGPFRGVWERLQAEPDPLAALMAPPPAQEPPFRLSAQPNAAPPMMPPQPSPSERMLRSQGYGHAMDHLNRINLLRARRGF